MDQIPLNWMAIGVATLLRMAAGALWYSPLLFVRSWQQLTGVTTEQMNARFGKAIALDLLMSLLMAFALANVIGASRIVDAANGAGAGVWLCLGFIVTTFLPLWLYEARPLKLIAINVGYNLVSLALMGALIGGWR